MAVFVPSVRRYAAVIASAHCSPSYTLRGPIGSTRPGYVSTCGLSPGSPYTCVVEARTNRAPGHARAARACSAPSEPAEGSRSAGDGSPAAKPPRPRNRRIRHRIAESNAGRHWSRCAGMDREGRAVDPRGSPLGGAEVVVRAHHLRAVGHQRHTGASRRTRPHWPPARVRCRRSFRSPSCRPAGESRAVLRVSR